MTPVGTTSSIDTYLPGDSLPLTTLASACTLTKSTTSKCICRARVGLFTSIPINAKIAPRPIATTGQSLKKNKSPLDVFLSRST